MAIFDSDLPVAVLYDAGMCGICRTCQYFLWFLRRRGFVIPSVTFCAKAGLWSVDITFGSGLQIPARV